MRLALATLLAGLVLAAPAGAAQVDVMVVGKRVLVPAKTVTLKERTVRVGGRRCTLGRATALAALAGTGASFSLRDYGACSRRPRDAGSLYVRRIGPDAERGRDGWVYKVGNRSGTAGAGDPGGAFGRGGLRDGQRVLWFWCVKDRRDRCQRTLGVTAPAGTRAGAPLRVTVRGYDEQGRGVAVAGARVRVGGSTGTTGPDGTAILTAPPAGRHTLEATKAGMVRAFPRTVTSR